MDPLAPIAGISLESYAELRALCADHPDDADACARVVQAKNVSREDWLAAHAGWLARLQDPSAGGVVSVRFVPAYQAALGQTRGPAPTLSFEEYVELSAQIQHAGLSSALARHDLDLFRYTQIAFSWNAAMSRDMQQFVTYVCSVEQELLRLLRGGERRPIPTLTTQLGTQATAYAAPAEAVAALAPAPAPAPVPAQQTKTLEEDAAEAAKAVGGALKSGFDKLGHALDSFGKNLFKPNVGSAVLVTWSDGNKYPGTVAEVAPGQFFVTMTNGEQFWVAEQYISSP